jgi:beta-glucanase (GH16 family)
MRPLLLALLLPGVAMADWKLQHQFDFTAAAALDPGFWSLESGFQRNQESQYYAADNVTVGPGVLRIEARREQVANAAHRAGARGWRSKPAASDYTSGSIGSRPAFLYGRFEVVARMPGGAGVWPAIWLVHESSRQYGEIDIHESVGKHPDTVFAGVHFGRTPNTRQHRNASRVLPHFEGSWHTHAVEWTPERITISIDGQPLFVFDPRDAADDRIDPLRRPMRLRINLALGGTWGGPVDDRRLPARLDIASVRIWSWQPGAGEPLVPLALPAGAAVSAVVPAALPAAVPATVPAAVPATVPAAVAPAPGTEPPSAGPRWGR